MAISLDLAVRDCGNRPGSANTTCHIIGMGPFADELIGAPVFGFAARRFVADAATLWLTNKPTILTIKKT
jgi:hypothetical protein